MPRAPVVFLLDVDNTLLDNDRIIVDLRRYLEREIGPERQKRYWEIFEVLRAELGYADYLGALQRYRVESPHDVNLLKVSLFLINYPFANRLFPASLDAIEQELADVERRHPAERYVAVDDKLRLLTAIKDYWQDRVTTVFPHQGQYAHDPRAVAQFPPADLAIERIGDLLEYDLPALLEAGRGN